MTLIITLILIGTAALLLELFIPGGIVGFLGALCLLGAIVTTFTEYGFNAGILTTLAILVMACVALYFWMKNFEKLPGMKHFILTQTAERPQPTEDESLLLNKKGETLTDLGPSGKALIDGKKFDVIAESGFIDQATAITVIEASGSKIVVRSQK